MRKLLLVLLAALAAVVAARTVLAPTPEPPPPAGAAFALDADEVLATRLAAAIRFPTISRMEPGERDAAPFAAQLAYLQQTYASVFATLETEAVNGYSLLMTWRGADPALPPVILLSHQDVVPISPGSEKDWEHPPFSGEVAGGFVWGRGSLDDKSGVLGTMAPTSASACTTTPRWCAFTPSSCKTR